MADFNLEALNFFTHPFIQWTFPETLVSSGPLEGSGSRNHSWAWTPKGKGVKSHLAQYPFTPSRWRSRTLPYSKVTVGTRVTRSFVRINMYTDGTLDLMITIALAAFKPSAEKEEDLALVVKRAKTRYFPAFEKVGGGNPVCLVAASSHPAPGRGAWLLSREPGSGSATAARADPARGRGEQGAGLWRPRAAPSSPSHSREGREMRGGFRAQQVPTDASRDAGIQDWFPVAEKNSSRVNIWKDQLW